MLWWCWTLMACCLGAPEGPPVTPEVVAGDSPCRPVTGDALRGELTDLDTTRRSFAISLTPVAEGCGRVTDIQFPPGQTAMVVVEQSGRVFWIDRDQDRVGVLFQEAIQNRGERGLLGLAFHPKFAENGRFFLNHTNPQGGTRIAELSLPGARLDGQAVRVQTLLDIPQPYSNHNAGQLQFGPDGLLYIGMGDGGAGNDPHGHGQNAGTLLGAMLRIDVDHPDEGRPYGIPADNPSKEGWRPEIWAIGLRNPWRYSFDPKGRLVVGDVGRDKWEEVSILQAGGNHGWNVREADHCFQPTTGCPTEGLVDPIYSYGRKDGNSITGGYVHTSSAVPRLGGHYVFGDFGSGRIWALDLPEDGVSKVQAHALGRFPILISTFGRDPDGRLYVASYRDGRIYRIDPG